jgi:hypothetical protein
MRLVAAALLLASLALTVAGDTYSTSRYRRETIDPINLAAEINGIISNVAEGDDTLSMVRSRFSDAAHIGQTNSLSNQVSTLRSIAADRVLGDEVDSLANLINIISTNVATTDSIIGAATDAIPDITSNQEVAVQAATNIFTSRVGASLGIKRANEKLGNGFSRSAQTVVNLQHYFELLQDQDVLESIMQLNATIQSTSVARELDLLSPLKLLSAFGNTAFGNSSLPVMRWARFSTYSQAHGWYFGNRDDLTGGVAPSTWGDGNGRTYQMRRDVQYMRTLFNKRVTCGWSCALHNEEWDSYSSTNSFQAGVLIRIRNTTPNTITWPVEFYYSSYGGWEEYASVAINFSNAWSTGSNCGNCRQLLSLSLSANYTHTIIFMSSASPESGTRTTMFNFVRDSLRLPEGLEYVDDLDYVQSI